MVIRDSFNLKEHRKLATCICEDDDPDWLVGSPPCTDFSVLGRWNHKRMKIEDVRRRLREARRHLEFCILLYNKQVARGKHFLHEHPQGASSWREGCIERLANKDGVNTTVGHMCQYGMAIIDDSGTSMPIMKLTRWLSSSVPMLRRLSAKCQNEHKHRSLLNGKAAGAAIYPQMLCVDILKGIRDTTIEEDLQKEVEFKPST